MQTRLLSYPKILFLEVGVRVQFDRSEKKLREDILMTPHCGVISIGLIEGGTP